MDDVGKYWVSIDKGECYLANLVFYVSPFTPLVVDTLGLVNEALEIPLGSGAVKLVS